MKLLALFLVLFSAPLHPAFGVAPGTAQGSLQVNGEIVPLSQAYAHLHDNAEGLLDRRTELRILLADRKIPQDALAGIVFLPVRQMATEGQVQGLLLQLDPDDRRRVVIILLYPPANPGQTLMTQSLSTTGQQALKKLEFTSQRVIGEIEHRDQREPRFTDMPKLDYAVQFSAPLFHEPPITADLQGKAAQDSPQVRLLRDKARALAKGDFEAIRRLSTDGANRRNQTFLAQAGADARSFAKQAAAERAKSLRRIRRVVVRGERAVAIFADKQWANFVREGREWKSDD